MQKNKPTFEEFDAYIKKRNFNFDSKNLFEKFEKLNWTTRSGRPAKTWQSLVNSLNGVVNKGSSKRKSNDIKSAKTDFDVWTDGSCNNLSPYGEGGSAYVVLKDGVLIHEAKYGRIGTSNNRMELLAIISAVNWIPANSSVIIYSDSQYAINVLSGKWKAKTNTDLVRLYDTAASRLSEIRFEWVKGHSGIEWNEYVDELASSETLRIAQEYHIPVYTTRNSPKCH